MDMNRAIELAVRTVGEKIWKCHKCGRKVSLAVVGTRRDGRPKVYSYCDNCGKRRRVF